MPDDDISETTSEPTPEPAPTVAVPLWVVQLIGRQTLELEAYRLQLGS